MAELDDFVGAVYAMVFSQSNVHPVKRRSGPIEIHTVIKRAEDVANGTLRISGNWMAGFHFNGALFRIAASYHRGLKVVLKQENSQDKKDRLLAVVMSAFPKWEHMHLDKVHAEV